MVWYVEEYLMWVVTGCWWRWRGSCVRVSPLCLFPPSHTPLPTPPPLFFTFLSLFLSKTTPRTKNYGAHTPTAPNNSSTTYKSLPTPNQFALYHTKISQERLVSYSSRISHYHLLLFIKPPTRMIETQVLGLVFINIVKELVWIRSTF
jgi:hypothetical protein